MAKPQAKSKVAPREAVLVLGMYASGASALTRVANLLGAAAPPYVVGDQAEATRDSWESAKLVALHDEMLATLDSAWDDWRPLNPSWRDGDAAARFADRIRLAVEDEFRGAPLFVLKDARLCRNLPFWMSALESANIRSAPLIIIRNPLEVAFSLRAHDGFNIEKSMLLWLRHYLDAEYETRHLPRNIVTYDALLEDWRSLAVQSAGRLGVTWPRTPTEASADIRAYLSHDLHHQRATKADLHASTETPAWVKDAYEALTRLCDEPKSGYAKRELDKVRQVFAESCKLFGNVAFADRARAKQFEAEMHAANARAETADTLRAELDRTIGAKDAREAELIALTARHLELQELSSRNEHEAQALNAAIEELRQTHDTMLTQVKREAAEASEAADELEQRAEAAERHIAELLNMVSELELREATSQEALTRMTSDAGELRTHAHDLGERIVWIEKELQSHLARNVEVTVSKSDKESLLAALQSGLLSSTQLQQELAAARLELSAQQAAALNATAEARMHANELISARNRIVDLEGKEKEAKKRLARVVEEAAASSAKASELQRLIDNAQASALRSNDDALRANEAAAELQRATREAENRLARLEEDLRFERLRVVQLEKRLATWLGLLGSAVRKAAGWPERARGAGQIARPTWR
jgi:hypothetical protein